MDRSLTQRSLAVLLSAALLLTASRTDILAQTIVRTAPAAAPAAAVPVVPQGLGASVSLGPQSLDLGRSLPGIGQTLPDLRSMDVRTDAADLTAAPAAARSLRSLPAGSAAVSRDLAPAAPPALTRRSAAAPLTAERAGTPHAQRPKGVLASSRETFRGLSGSRRSRSGVSGTLKRFFDGSVFSRKDGGLTPSVKAQSAPMRRPALGIRPDELKPEGLLKAGIARLAAPALPVKSLRTKSKPWALAVPAALLSAAGAAAYFADFALKTALLSVPAAVLGGVIAHQILARVFQKSESHPDALESAAATAAGGALAFMINSLLAPWSMWAAAGSTAAMIAAVYMLKSRAHEIDDFFKSRFPEDGKEGLLDMDREDGKLIADIREDQLEKPFLLTATVERGIGENWLYSMSPMDDAIVYFRRSGGRIQLMRKNMDYRTKPGSQEALGVERSFSDSVIASAKIGEQSWKKGKRSWTIDMGSIFRADLFKMGDFIASSYPDTEYLHDEEKTVVQSAKVYPKNVEIETEMSFFGAVYDPSMPVPDARTLNFVMRYSLLDLPEDGFETRRFDERVGYQREIYRDFSGVDRLGPHQDPTVRLIQRWRLEKQDPDAELSRPKKPIVWWVDHTVPERHRPAVREAVLNWNKAFERLGFKDAIVVRDAPEPGKEPADELEAQYDPADARYNVVRWFAGTDADIAYAINLTDPRTGEIFKASVDFSFNMLDASWFRTLLELLKQPGAQGHDRGAHPGHKCSLSKHAALALKELQSADMSPELRERFVHDLLVSLLTHEIGHTLGLEHNFAASTFKTLDEIEDARDGVLSQSVMDYTPYNHPTDESRKGAFSQTELGPYDYLAVEYGYRDFGAMSEDEKRKALLEIAGRIGEPGLEFASDAEAASGMDPYATQFDYGPEPLQYAQRSIERAEAALRILLKRAQPADFPYYDVRGSFLLTFYRRVMAVKSVIAYIGGVRARRARTGRNAEKPPYEAIPLDKQREALEFLDKNLFAGGAFYVPPVFLAKMGQDMRGSLDDAGYPDSRHFPYEEMVAKTRIKVLQRLFEPERLRRLVETRGITPKRRKAFSIEELFTRTRKMLFDEFTWKGEAKTNYRNASASRREVQAAYVDMMIEIFAYPDTFAERVKDDKRVPSDAVAAARNALARLQWHLSRALKVKGINETNKQHLKLLIWKIKNALDTK